MKAFRRATFTARYLREAALFISPGKGNPRTAIELAVRLEEEGRTFEWSLRLIRDEHEFYVEERIDELPRRSPPVQVLYANRGEGWWWSGEKGDRVRLKQAPTACALAAAAADASFPARGIAQFVGRWGVLRPESVPVAQGLERIGLQQV